MDKDNKLIEVCDNCLTASCWYGEFMCDAASNAGTTLKTIKRLTELSLEHRENWSNKKLMDIYGNPNPHGYRNMEGQNG